MEPSRTTYRWVAGPDDARTCARALYLSSVRFPRIWVTAVAILLGITGASTVSAWPRSIFVGVGYAAVFLVAIYAATYVGVRRRTASQLPSGLALESEFGDDFVTLRGPSVETKVRFSGLDRVRRSGDWVVLRQQRSRAISCWPVALFPDAELSRLQQGSSGRR